MEDLNGYLISQNDLQYGRDQAQHLRHGVLQGVVRVVSDRVQVFLDERVK